jgi:hypothetical protein
LTHSEDASLLVNRYTPASFFLPLIKKFNNIDFQHWLENISIPTYIGSSKRVFPKKGIKPVAVLNAILSLIAQRNIPIKTQHLWKGWSPNNELIFENQSNTIFIKPDITVFALGGASWKITGSDGNWVSHFKEKSITIIPFQASNCAYKIDWPSSFIEVTEGKSLKNISLTCNTVKKKGEVVITKFGLEGGAIYALSPEIRRELTFQGYSIIYIDLKPSLSEESIFNKIKQRGNNSISKLLETELNMNSLQLSLLKSFLNKTDFTNPETLAKSIKQFPLRIINQAPIEEAISTVGGISLDEITNHFELKKLPNNFVIGEMLDWDAPTGGYLLQGCFSFGYTLASYLNSSI